MTKVLSVQSQDSVMTMPGGAASPADGIEPAQVGIVVYVSPRENENIWAATLAAVLRQVGAEVRFFQLHAHENNADEVCAQIKAFSPALVILALYDYNNLGVYFEDFAVVDAYRPLCARLRQALPSVHINAGSWFVTYCAEQYLRDHEEIDSITIGEAEETVPDLVRHLMSGRSLDNCPGIIFRRAEQLVRTPVRPAIRDLDSIPFMARDLYRGGPARLATSRGCHAACEFCSIAYFAPFNDTSRWRGRTPGSIVSEIAHLVHDHGVDTIEFEDGSFEDQGRNGYDQPYGRMLAICDMLEKASLDIMFAVFMRTATALRLSADMWERLRSAGLYKIFVGVDSVDQQMRKKYRKPSFRLEAVPGLRRRLLALNIEMRVGYIMFDPWVDFARLRASIAFLKELDHLCWAQCWTPLELLPGLPVIDRVAGDDLLAPDYRYDRPWSYRYAEPRIEPLALGIKDLMRAQPKLLDTKLKHCDIALHRRRHLARRTPSLEGGLGSLGSRLEEHRRVIAANNEEFLVHSFDLAENGWSFEAFKAAIEQWYSPDFVDPHVASLDDLLHAITTS